MNPDQTPASHLPAPLSSPTTLLLRTQAALELLRDVVQESSAEYWYERGKAAIAQEKLEEAQQNLHKSIELSNENSKIWRIHLQLAVVHANEDCLFFMIKQINLALSKLEMTWTEFTSELTNIQWRQIRQILWAHQNNEESFSFDDEFMIHIIDALTNNILEDIHHFEESMEEIFYMSKRDSNENCSARENNSFLFYWLWSELVLSGWAYAELSQKQQFDEAFMKLKHSLKISEAKGYQNSWSVNRINWISQFY